MTSVRLMHKTDSEHLETVKAEMLELGQPRVRVIEYGNDGYVAIEGVHRLTAAYELGIAPVLVDYSNEETVTLQVDGYDEELTNEEVFEWAAAAVGDRITFDEAEEEWA